MTGQNTNERDSVLPHDFNSLVGYPISLEDKKHLFTAKLDSSPNAGPPDSL